LNLQRIEEPNGKVFRLGSSISWKIKSNGGFMALIYEELTKELRQCVYDVHNALGTGYDEETYHQAMIIRVEKSGVPVRSKEKRFIEHRGEKVHEFELDLIADDKVIFELKALQSDFLQPNLVQIISYLKLWQKQLGLLVNFGLPKAKIKRIPFSEKAKKKTENYDYIKNILAPADREHLRNLREAILTVFEMHGLGYGESIYQELILAELRHRKITYAPKTIIPVEYEGRIIRNFEMNLPVIEGRFILGITALQKQIEFYDIARIQTYLRALNLQIGLLVNFGKKELQITGVRA
jgi:GxxExxY protein